MRCFRILLTISTVLLLATAITVSCVKAGGDRPVITVTLPPQKYFVEQIAGDRIDVRCLLSNGANPETYDPTVTNMMNLDKSIAFLRVGNVGFEDAIIDKISSVNPDLPVYNTSDGIEIITGTHIHHAPDGSERVTDEPDPHTWSSVRNASVMARNILKALVEVDPSNAAFYRANCDRFTAHLDSLDSLIATRLNQAGNPSFIVWHPSLSYFARDYGLRQIAVGGAENKDVSIESVRAAIDSAAGSDVRVFFFQKDIDHRRLEAINSAISAREVTINPQAADWEGEILTIVDALTQK